jgi:ATP-dependent Lon protease
MKTEAIQSIHIEAGEKISVFPLPNSILFPHVEVPLYIFEQRYRKMLRDCMHGNNLMAISPLRKGWEAAKEPYPSYDIVSVGYVKLSVENPDGTSNIILRGVARVKISEYVQLSPYRIAKVMPLQDTPPNAHDIEWRARKLSKLFLQKLLMTTKIQESEIRSLENMTNAEEIANLVSYTSNVDIHVKQELLETLKLETKTDRLIQILETELASLKKQRS